MARVPLICVPNSPSVTIVGDAFRVYATLQIIGPAILSLWAVGPGRLSKATTAAAVALAAFVVVLPWPQSTNLIAKRISLGQITPPCWNWEEISFRNSNLRKKKQVKKKIFDNFLNFTLKFSLRITIWNNLSRWIVYVALKSPTIHLSMLLLNLMTKTILQNLCKDRDYFAKRV